MGKLPQSVVRHMARMAKKKALDKKRKVSRARRRAKINPGADLENSCLENSPGAHTDQKVWKTSWKTSSETSVVRIIKRWLADERGYTVRSDMRIVSINLPIRVLGKLCGFCDLIGFQEGRLYAIEIKGGFRGTDTFWGATKIIAYTKVMNLEGKTQYLPAILIPKECVTSDIMAMSAVINLKLLAYEIDEKSVWISDLSRQVERKSFS